MFSSSTERIYFVFHSKHHPKAGRRVTKRRLHKSTCMSTHPFQLTTPEKTLRKRFPIRRKHIIEADPHVTRPVSMKSNSRPASRVSRSDETAGFWLIARGQPRAGRRMTQRRLHKKIIISARLFQLSAPEKLLGKQRPRTHLSTHQTAGLKRRPFFLAKICTAKNKKRQV